MKLMIHGNDILITEAMKDKISAKFNFLDTYLKQDDVVEVNIHKDNRLIKMVIMVPKLNGEKLIIKEKDIDFYTCVDLAQERLKIVFKKNREKLRNSKKRQSRSAQTSGNQEGENNEVNDIIEEDTLAAMQLKYGL